MMEIGEVIIQTSLIILDQMILYLILLILQDPVTVVGVLDMALVV
jgi:hypothetical protein